MINHISIDGINNKRSVERAIQAAVGSIESHIPKADSGRVVFAIHPDSKHKNQYTVMIKATALNKDAIVHCNDENVYKAIKNAQRKIIFQIERLKKKVLKSRKNRTVREERYNWAG